MSPSLGICFTATHLIRQIQNPTTFLTTSSRAAALCHCFFSLNVFAATFWIQEIFQCKKQQISGMFLTASPRAATVCNTPMTVKPVMVTSQPYLSTCHRHVILQCNWTCDHLNTIPNLNVGHYHFHFLANMQLLMSQRGLTHIHLTLTSPP